MVAMLPELVAAAVGPDVVVPLPETDPAVVGALVGADVVALLPELMAAVVEADVVVPLPAPDPASSSWSTGWS